MKNIIFRLRPTSLLATVLFIATGSLLNAQGVKLQYKIVNKIHLDSNSGWDYLAVDEKTNMLYVSHGNCVQVVDLTAGKMIATIPNTIGVHGIAIANELNKGFISAGKGNAVIVFNLKTNATITKINLTGLKPDCIVYDHFTKKVFTMNGKSNNATAIDAVTNNILATVPLDGKPEFCVDDGRGNLFVNIEDKSEVEEIDAIAMKVLRHWSIAPGESPTGLAIDRKNRRLFSVCDNQMMVVSDADAGSVVATVPIGDHPDAAGFDPEKMRAYSSNGDGTLTVVHEESPGKFTVLENVPTQKGAKTMALNFKTHHIYLSSAEYLPAETNEEGKTKAKIKPGTFAVLDVEEED